MIFGVLTTCHQHSYLLQLRFPDFMTTEQDGGKVVSLTYRPPLYQEMSWYSFLLQAESTTGS